ncbi:hypothetical protein DV515_00007962, partial [Chloebia gouldiae]
PHEIVTCNSQICSWSPLQVLNDDSDVLFPVSAVGSYSQAGGHLNLQNSSNLYFSSGQWKLMLVHSTLDNLENGEGHEHAVHPVELVPRRSDLPYRMEISPPAQVNTSSSMLPSATVPESMTITDCSDMLLKIFRNHELRQAIVAMMNRKDELEEQNRSLRNLLDAEMEHSAALRQEMENCRRKVAEQEERHATKVQALARTYYHLSFSLLNGRSDQAGKFGIIEVLEKDVLLVVQFCLRLFIYFGKIIIFFFNRENEVLKVQLKKYVGAVQMLRREGQTVEVLPNIWSTDGEFTIPEQKQVENNEELASSYERKLIEVAEMHGELIEFNERLHRALMAKEALVFQMRQELIDLRGPVPGDLSQTSEDQSLSDFEISNRALINVWIPSVFLRGKAANAFHVYQVSEPAEQGFCVQVSD